jgi:hypothetical protein
MHRLPRIAIIALALMVFGLIGGSAASPVTTHTKQEAAKKILGSHAGPEPYGPGARLHGIGGARRSAARS